MPRPSIDLEPYKAEIISLFEHDNSAASIATTLQTKHNLKITDCTIKSCLQGWGIHKRNHMTTSDIVLYNWIKILFFQLGLEDKELLQVLQDEGFDVTNRTLKRLRTQLGLRCRTKPIEAEQQADEIVQAIEKELEKGTIEGYGKELLHRHFRSQGFMIAR